LMESLPECVGDLRDLRELHLRNNRLRSLPDSIGRLKELRQIDLRGNPIVRLPEALLGLPRLDKVDLRWVSTLEDGGLVERLRGRGCVVYL